MEKNAWNECLGGLFDRPVYFVGPLLWTWSNWTRRLEKTLLVRRALVKLAVRKFCLKWPKMQNWLDQPFLIWFRPGIYSVRPVQRLSPVAVQIKLFQNHIFTRGRIFKFHVRKDPTAHLILISEIRWHWTVSDISLSPKFLKLSTTSRCR